MKQIRRIIPSMRIVTLLLSLEATGCGPPPDTRDQRLAEFAQQSVAQQSQQNEHIARQSQAVIEESRQLADTAQQLVTMDAEARQDLIAAQERLNAQLHRQRAAIDAGRDNLERERRQIAEQRNRDPVIAASIESIGMLLACLLPLALCGLLIWRLGRVEPDDAAVAELLICDLFSDRPALLPGPASRPALSHHLGVDQPGESPLDDESDQVDPPF